MSQTKGWQRAYPDGRNDLIRRLSDMLKRMEWVWVDQADAACCAMSCGRRQADGHRPDCELAALLKESEE